MKLKNCTIDEFVESRQNGFKKIVIFGVGTYYVAFRQSRMKELAHKVAYAIDNNEVSIGSRIEFYGDVEIDIFKPNRVEDEVDCAIVITSPVYMYEMYTQLDSMKVNDSVYCYIYPFMTISGSINQMNAKIKDFCTPYGRGNIPKRIHTFWFSGEPIPDSYKKCVDTWYKYCPDYEINIWTKENYDCSKAPFIEKAIKFRAWAHASDFARLDVMYECGGVYMDMDVELCKSLDDLLEYKAVFSYGDCDVVELAMFMSCPLNPIIHSLLDLYKNISEPPTNRKEFNVYFQPVYIIDKLVDFGVKINGKIQEVEGNCFLPRTYFFPIDCRYEMDLYGNNTYAIHHANVGWKPQGYVSHKKEGNRRLWQMIDQ